MEVELNPDGTRNRSYRPYIEQEELNRNIHLYNPNGLGYHHGLYDGAQPSCQVWQTHYRQHRAAHPEVVPARVIDNAGRQHQVRPSWYSHGLRYDALSRHL